MKKTAPIEWKPIVLPNDGIEQVTAFIRSAARNIDCKHFKLIDPSVIQELIAAQKRVLPLTPIRLAKRRLMAIPVAGVVTPAPRREPAMRVANK